MLWELSNRLLESVSMAETVSRLADRPDDERATARAISELLVRVGNLEGERISLRTEVEMLRAVVNEYRTEIDRMAHSVRAQTGRSAAAAERVRKAQMELREQVANVRLALIERRPGE